MTYLNSAGSNVVELIFWYFLFRLTYSYYTLHVGFFTIHPRNNPASFYSAICKPKKPQIEITTKTNITLQITPLFKTKPLITKRASALKTLFTSCTLHSIRVICLSKLSAFGVVSWGCIQCRNFLLFPLILHTDAILRIRSFTWNIHVGNVTRLTPHSVQEIINRAIGGNENDHKLLFTLGGCWMV